MATTTERFLAIIDAHTSGAIKGLSDFDKQVSKSNAQFDKFANKIGVSGATLKAGLAGLASGVSVGAIVDGLHQAAEAYVAAAQAAGMLSKVTNATVEDASRFNAVASRTGLQMNDLVEIFSDFQQAVAKSPAGLERMGVALAQTSTGQTDWLATAEDFLTAVQGIGDATERNRLMFQYFGEEGAKQLMTLVNSGQSLQQALANVPDELIINAEGVQAAQNYQKAMGDLDNTLKSLSTTVGRDLVPALTAAAEGLGVIADVGGAMEDKLPLDFLTRAFPVIMLGLKGVGAAFGDDAAAASDYAESLTEVGTATATVATAQQTLTATIASGAASGEAFAAAVAAAGDELAEQDANARLAAQALDLYRASTDQAYEATLNLLTLDHSQRSAQRAAEGASDAAADAKANMDKALADAKQAKVVVEKITAIQGRARKKREDEGIVAGSTDVSAVEGVKGRRASTRTKILEAAGFITPAEERQIREAARAYEQSLDDISQAWVNLAQARVKHKEALGIQLSEVEKLDIVAQTLKEGLKIPGLSADAKKDLRADLKVVEDQIKALGGVPVIIDGIKFAPGTSKAAVAQLQKDITAAMKVDPGGAGAVLKGQLDAMKVDGGIVDLKATLGLDPASVEASRKELANVGIDPKTGKPYTAKTVAKVDKTQAQKDLDALTKDREMTVVVNLVPGTGGSDFLPPAGNFGPVPRNRINFATAQQVAFSPVVNITNPAPERASDSIASSLRVAKYMVST